MSDMIRKAASIVAVRDRDGAPEVLVIERSPDARFLPGYVAFPGGAVDGTDADLAQRWFGDREHAPRACALRELIEEVGLCPSDDGLRPAFEAPFELLEAARLDAERLHPLAHWIAPPDVPVRFDADYFTLLVRSSADPLPDGEEAAAARWVSPARLLGDWDSGAARLYWPTYFTVRQLARCSSAGEVMQLAFDTREPDEDELARLPRSVFWQDGGLT